ncbi:MAG: DUF2461 domain-containing protein [Gammaproteobacteria bacterium]|nr:DUF2461 domain-containing protein [Gammaproteobacteria bacterium]MDE0258910.1 DUF2461 domain-containing protein [Gammaproteobacteria bacterium]
MSSPSDPIKLMNRAYFTPATFDFLTELAANNNRDWFTVNKTRYEGDVKASALRFISDFAPHLARISPRFRADPRANGGSLFRIYRDTRFSRDKSPYKTHTGIHFRHEAAKDAHAPGFYLHLEPGSVFVGCGIWRPGGPALRKIREAIDENPDAWLRASRDEGFRASFELEGDSLIRAPKGFSVEHPLIVDLRRKDFIGVAHLSEEAVSSEGFLETFAGLCRDAAPFQRWLCGALGVGY